jgi:hypothetical protein
MTKVSYVLLGLIMCLPFIGYIGVLYYNDVVFTQEIGGHMERASNANTVSLALEEMKIVVENIEKNGYTEGYTSVIYRTPDEDVGFWYLNMKESLEELKKVNPNSTQLEQSNVLMKLRETLVDNSEDGMSITVPKGISRFPYNLLYAIIFWITFIFAIFGVTSLWIGVSD